MIDGKKVILATTRNLRAKKKKNFAESETSSAPTTSLTKLRERDQSGQGTIRPKGKQVRKTTPGVK